MKTYWAFGGDAGRPAGDLAAGMRANGAPEPLVWMEQHGIDFTVLGAFGGVLLLTALTRPWGERLPRWALLTLGWAGALALTPYGFATLIASAVGFTVGDAEGWSPWVGYVGGLAFAGLGLSLGLCTRFYGEGVVRHGEKVADLLAPISDRADRQPLAAGWIKEEHAKKARAEARLGRTPCGDRDSLVRSQVDLTASLELAGVVRPGR